MKGFIAYPKENFNIGKIYDKYRNGDHITDNEIRFAIKELAKALDVLVEMGAVFALPWKEMHRIREGLKEMKRARKLE